MNKNIFRAYDIRGNANSDLTNDFVIKIGQILGRLVTKHGDKRIYLGYDSRLSADRIRTSLIRGFNASKVEPILLGLVPTPLLYYATKVGEVKHGVMITGSHNPKDDNGFKMIINDLPVSGEEILTNMNKDKDFDTTEDKCSEVDFSESYVNEITSQVLIKGNPKIILDPGNGASGPLAKKLFNKLDLDFDVINTIPDGSFPNHHPDPSKEKNLDQIYSEIITKNYDYGFAFDGDGDRVALITKTQKIIFSDTLVMVLAKKYLEELGKGSIVYDVKCSDDLAKLISNYGGTPIMEKTGHFNIKKSLKSHNAILGGEMSGHIFINHNWYGFDDGLYAAVKLIEIFSSEGKPVDDIIKGLTRSCATPELNLNIEENQKFSFIEKFKKEMDFDNAKISEIDGVRVSYKNSWGLLRASNTSPKLVLRFEGKNMNEMEFIKSKFEENLKRIFPEINLNYH
tara:strand:+ start:222 stop:1586 length:1365 start_codon:yes stop_codon:yes gene_type:complete